MHVYIYIYTHVVVLTLVVLVLVCPTVAQSTPDSSRQQTVVRDILSEGVRDIFSSSGVAPRASWRANFWIEMVNMCKNSACSYDDNDDDDDDRDNHNNHHHHHHHHNNEPEPRMAFDS